MSKKKVSEVARTKKESSELEQRDRAMKGEYGPVKFVEEEETAEGWQLDRLTEEYHWKILKTLLSSDLVLKILKPKLIGKIKSLISSPVTASNTLEGIYGIVQLLRRQYSSRGFLTRRNYWIVNKIR